MTDLNDILRRDGVDAARAQLDSSHRASLQASDNSTDAPSPPVKSFVTTASILSANYPELRWAVDGYVAEGLSVLAGRQKLGKSRMALDFAIAVATGGTALGKIQVDQGDVLYVDLENGARRVQRRLKEAFPYAEHQPDLSRLTWCLDAPQIHAGFLERLDEWRVGAKDPTLVIVDVLQRIKPSGGSRNQNAYERDYECFAGLQKWATAHGIALLALHHTRKGGADDPLEALSGSNGLSAVADTTLVLDRDSQGATLYVRGRDVHETDSALVSVDGQWHLQGEASEVRRSDTRTRILTTLETSQGPLSPREIADLTGLRHDNVRKVLTRMAAAGEVEKPSAGHYAHPCHSRHKGHSDGGDGWNGSDAAVKTPWQAVTPSSGVTNDNESGATTTRSSSGSPVTPVVTSTPLETASDPAPVGAAVTPGTAVTQPPTDKIPDGVTRSEHFYVPSHQEKGARGGSDGSQQIVAAAS